MDIHSKQQDQKLLRQTVWNQLVLGDMQGWIINPKQYSLFDKLLLAVVGACGVHTPPPYIFPTRANQHIQENNRQFDENLNNFDPMFFAANQQQNEYYTYKDMLFQPYNSGFILSKIKKGWIT